MLAKDRDLVAGRYFGCFYFVFGRLAGSSVRRHVYLRYTASSSTGRTKKKENWSRSDFLFENGCVLHKIQYSGSRTSYFPLNLRLSFLPPVFLQLGVSISLLLYLSVEILPVHTWCTLVSVRYSEMMLIVGILFLYMAQTSISRSTSPVLVCTGRYINIYIYASNTRTIYTWYSWKTFSSSGFATVRGTTGGYINTPDSGRVFLFEYAAVFLRLILWIFSEYSQ